MTTILSDEATETFTAVHAANVQRGIAVLDAKVPGWRDKVDLDILDVGSIANCVLGQVFGNPHDFDGWGRGMKFLFGSTSNDFSVPHGFERYWGTDDTYDSLDEAWSVALSS